MRTISFRTPTTYVLFPGNARTLTKARGSDFRRAALGDKLVRFFSVRFHRTFKHA